ncbi:MAG: hypothetical protein HY939_00425 [Gammaproteobacteria bacterium]|nr:hypothetical protein [Gammaproteobacteria bacterium]
MSKIWNKLAVLTLSSLLAAPAFAVDPTAQPEQGEPQQLTPQQIDQLRLTPQQQQMEREGILEIYENPQSNQQGK